MTYDLFLRSSIPTNYARGDEVPQKTAPAVSALRLVLAGVVLALPAYMRHREIRQYREQFSSDESYGSRNSRRRLSTTIEMPAMSMSDMVYGNQQTE